MFKRPFDLVERLRIPMGPRKKSKPSPAEGEEGRQPRQNDDTQAGETQSLDVPVAPSLRGVAASQASQSTPQLVSSKTQDIQKQVENRASWYGSWRGRPAKPVAEVAKDNASSVSLPQSPRVQPSDRRTTGTSSAAPVPPSPRRYMSGSMRKASKGDALPASMSNLSVVSDSAKNVSEQPPPVSAAEEAPKETAPEPPLPPDPPTKDGKSKDDAAARSQGQQNANGSWFGWWSRPDGYVEKSADEQKDKTDEAAQQKPLPESPVEERTQPKLDQTQTSTATAVEMAPSQTDTNQSTGPALSVGTQRSSWFWLWSSQQNAQGTEQPPNTNGVKAPSTTSTTTTVDTTKDTPMRDAQAPKDPEPTPAKTDPKPDSKTAQPSAPRKSTGWAFWSREEPEDEQDTSKTHKQVGEIAVEGTPSQNHPEAAQFNESAEQEQASKEITKGKPKSGRGRNVAKDSQKQPATPSKNTPSGSPDRKNPIEPKVAAVAGKSSKDQPKQSPGEPKKEDKNILLPDFNSTYSLLQQPTLWSQIRRLFVADTANLPTPHLHLTPTPPKIKKALAIGIHGFFPSPIYQKILGPPTGTSIRFSNCAASAIKSWGDAHNQPDISIEKIALEGEGLIRERVDTLWKLLLNWIEHIRSADFILVACHSQGVPVSIMLLQKLLQFGCIGPNVRVGVCAMAGISLGPFAEYKTRLFGGTGLELFEFAEPESRVSKMYRGALEEVLGAGVRIVYVGSIDDQLVSLESSTFSPPSHPNIYRAVFIDGRLHTSDFLTRLIGFTLKLRNLGLPDHGLVRELSPALAGSLYTGEGHSSLHNYMPIYELAVRHALETIPSPPEAGVKGGVIWGPLQGPPSVKDANPFFLPWAMRGILEEESVKRLMGREVEELLGAFEEWRPVSKGLRDVKFRLEAVRSKL